MPLVQDPWYRLPRTVRLAVGWTCLLAIVFGSAFGFPLQGVSSLRTKHHGAYTHPTHQNTTFADRGISVLGLFVFQTGFFLSSRHRSHIPWPTVIVGLFLQQVIALFVLKSGAGFSIFHWIATLANDFLDQGLAGVLFFFDQEVVGRHWFFANTVRSFVFWKWLAFFG
jgi:CNT family concentrative nucleoside transporter